MELFLRILIMAAFLAVPFILLALAEGKAEGILWLMFPIILMLPVLLLCALVLGSVEYVSAHMGVPADLSVPAFGALIVGAFGYSRLTKMHSRSQGGGSAARAYPARIAGFLALGTAIGLAWRVTPHALEYLGYTLS